MLAINYFELGYKFNWIEMKWTTGGFATWEVILMRLQIQMMYWKKISIQMHGWLNYTSFGATTAICILIKTFYGQHQACKPGISRKCASKWYIYMWFCQNYDKGCVIAQFQLHNWCLKNIKCKIDLPCYQGSVFISGILWTFDMGKSLSLYAIQTTPIAEKIKTLVVKSKTAI